MLFLLGNYKMHGGFCPVSNIGRSVLEVQRWKADKPQKYFGYIQIERTPTPSRMHGPKCVTVKTRMTTWMGDVIGNVHLGDEYYDNFGGVRQSVWMKGTNGLTYWGTYFKSAGDYARITAHKNQPTY